VNQMTDPIRIVLAALLALLVFSPATQANGSENPSGVSDTASYGYQVTGIDYSAKADLAGLISPSADTCTPGVDAVFRGHIDTTNASEVAELRLGSGAVTIHSHGTSGHVHAQLTIASKLSESWHQLSVDCEGAEKQTPCTQSAESKMDLSLGISGAVGDRVKFLWSFSQSGDRTAGLVPNSFSCVEPMTFPGSADGSCNSFSGLSRFTAKTIKLPFICHAQRGTPPNNGRPWRIYAGTASAEGVLTLKRTWQR
jgi:hypothetical protein